MEIDKIKDGETNKDAMKVTIKTTEVTEEATDATVVALVAEAAVVDVAAEEMAVEEAAEIIEVAVTGEDADLSHQTHTLTFQMIPDLDHHPEEEVAEEATTEVAATKEEIAPAQDLPHQRTEEVAAVKATEVAEVEETIDVTTEEVTDVRDLNNRNRKNLMISI